MTILKSVRPLFLLGHFALFLVLGACDPLVEFSERLPGEEESVESDLEGFWYFIDDPASANIDCAETNFSSISLVSVITGRNSADALWATVLPDGRQGWVTFEVFPVTFADLLLYNVKVTGGAGSEITDGWFLGQIVLNDRLDGSSDDVVEIRWMSGDWIMFQIKAGRIEAEFNEAENDQTVQVEISREEIAALVRETPLDILFSNSATLKRFCDG